MSILDRIQKLSFNYFWLFASIAFSFFYFYRISNLFPFYFVFDMDQITVLDSILIETNKLPDHYYHTSYGMYLTLAWINRVLAIFGISHIVTLDSLRSSLNPFNDIVFITQVFRVITVATCTGIVVLLSQAFIKVFKSFSKLLPFIVFAFTLIPGMIWQSAMLKSEQYSVLYLLISFLQIEKSLDMEKQGRIKYHNLMILLAGVASGLALITKVQCLFLISIMTIRFFSSSERVYKNSKIVAFNFLLFFMLMTAAYFYNPSNGAIIAAAGYGLNTFSLFLILLIVAPLVQYVRVSASLDFLKVGSRYFIFYALGIMLSFFTHFTLFSHGSVGLAYFLLDFKVVFLRILGSEVYLSPSEYMQRLGWQLKLNPFAIILILFNLYFWIKAVLSKKKQEFAFSTLLMFVMMAHLLVIVRNFNSDHLWFDVGLVFILIIHGSIVFKLFDGFNRKYDYAVIFALLLGFVVNAWNQYPKKIDNLYGAVSQYGFNKRASLSAVYGGNQPLFDKVVAEKASNEEQRTVFENHASRLKEFLPIAKGVFRSYEILPSSIAPLTTKINFSSLGQVTVQGPTDSELQNGFLIAPNYKNIRSEILWSKDDNVDQLRLIEQVTTRTLSESEFAVYTRRDIKVYLLVGSEIGGTQANPIGQCQNFKIFIDGKETFCYELLRSQIIDLNQIKPLFFYIKLS